MTATGGPAAVSLSCERPAALQPKPQRPEVAGAGQAYPHLDELVAVGSAQGDVQRGTAHERQNRRHADGFNPRELE